MQKQKTIAVFGLGRVGLPLALKFCEAGCTVWGVDIDSKRIADIKEGRFPFMERGGQALLERVQEKLNLTQDIAEAVEEAEDIILTLGTAIDQYKNPNFSQIMLVIDNIKPYLRKGHHLVLRSTVSPGFPEYLTHHLEDTTTLSIGKDFFVSHCPERIAEGYALEEISTIPQIIGVDDEASQKRATELFSMINNNLICGSTKSAAAAKIICNMSRYIVFAAANDLDMWMRKLNVDSPEAFRLAKTDYKRNVLKVPGPTAGPCLVKDGNISQESSSLYRAAEIVNEGWPIFYSKMIAKFQYLHGKKVAILGVAFKADVDDDRDSLSHKICKFFEREFAKVFLHDPHIQYDALESVLAEADVVVVAVNHSAYRQGKLLQTILKLANPEAILWDLWNIFERGWDPKTLHDYR